MGLRSGKSICPFGRSCSPLCSQAPCLPLAKFPCWPPARHTHQPLAQLQRLPIWIHLGAAGPSPFWSHREPHQSAAPRWHFLVPSSAPGRSSPRECLAVSGFSPSSKESLCVPSTGHISSRGCCCSAPFSLGPAGRCWVGCPEDARGPGAPPCSGIHPAHHIQDSRSPCKGPAWVCSWLRSSGKWIFKGFPKMKKYFSIWVYPAWLIFV